MDVINTRLHHTLEQIVDTRFGATTSAIVDLVRCPITA